jgi:hypothetical protein
MHRAYEGLLPDWDRDLVPIWNWLGDV